MLQGEARLGDGGLALPLHDDSPFSPVPTVSVQTSRQPERLVPVDMDALAVGKGIFRLPVAVKVPA